MLLILLMLLAALPAGAQTTLTRGTAFPTIQVGGAPAAGKDLDVVAITPEFRVRDDGGRNFEMNITAGASPRFKFNTSGASGDDQLMIGTEHNGPLLFETNSITRMTIAKGGEVSIGDGPSGNVPVCAKYTVAETDLTASSTTEDETLFTLPARGKLTGVNIKHSAAFTGGSISEMTVSVGDSSSATFYTAAEDIFQAAGDTVFQDTDMFKSSTMAARPVLATFTSTGDDVADATAGSVDIVACWVVLP